MEKDKKLLLSLVAILIGISSLFGGLAYFKNPEQSKVASDAIKFKEEYEFYNGKINETNKMNYPLVEVKEDNPMKYLSDDEAAEFLKYGTGVVYFGFSTCPWCRTMIPLLLKAAENTNLGEIQYVNIKDIRDQLTLNDNNEIIVTNEGTNGYHAILKELDSYLEPFYLTSKDGKKIDTKEKRLYAPTVLVIRDGKVLDMHVDTIPSQTSGYTSLTDDEMEKLYEIYQNMILKLLDSTCDESC